MRKHFFLWPLVFVAAAVLIMTGPAAAQAESETVYVFVNPDVPDNAITRAEIQNIYLGRKERWNDNQRISFTALGSSSSCHQGFLQEYVGRTDFQFQNYWKKQIFTGKGQPPRSFNSEADLIDYVSRTSGAVGYSCTPPDNSKVKILTVN